MTSLKYVNMKLECCVRMKPERQRVNQGTNIFHISLLVLSCSTDFV